MLKIAALVDLRRRLAAVVSGRKRVWAVVITLADLGGLVPIGYFLFGRRRPR